MKQMDWEDLRYVLAVADEGSLSGAARKLGVNHATVLRRVNGFEQNMALAIFDRTARGYRIAPRRRRVIEAMRGVEEAALKVERAITAARSPLAGVVRVTSTDTFCLGILPEIIAGLQLQAEGLEIELSSQNQHADLARLDADIAVRPADKLPPELTGVIAGHLGVSVYAAPGGADAWLGLSGSIARVTLGAKIGELTGEARVGARSDSFPVLREMAAAGQGRAILPCILGDADARLVRLDGLIPPTSVPIWVASHVDLAEVPRIRAVRDLIITGLERAGPRLLGSNA
ncbi:LysR family transcriptional regulator [Maritimibacter sp. UBA3975]|uniref:LysR family transcriptional regulator n=1 Tax=Maritimibacter sp. UBA3975 TaxID=1946833 RepID=UPI000C09245F|nr:LysR family transcriptional regulator [Maritimibacter sp. UBA3975]MAM60596.1 hypothetical protein [Maritimibacter sp.]|tara:strand:+ start:30473 stop:31336 length:864 start_codon:yes stop_codon:yes gene_type:complete